MLKTELNSTSTITSKSSETTTVSSDGLTCVTEKRRHVEIKTQNCDGEENTIVEEHGGSISERLAALQRSGSEN
ncbi:hypothetical protein CEXT_365691 [Caerostris extrusa]|uniref:Uncharacterized protein n=1 Tax=Caerostris extrusa TaxID=172846 RepID=A0AAV4XWI5_CAEEX|nr:hypothetical protein CEXT_365691 [Caerostris extrusa]